MVELLSPAGSWETLKSGISEGADAVYFGVERFNARARAGNFKSKQLSQVIDYCHDNGVKAYLTVNTSIKDRELSDFFEIIQNSYSKGIDAVILQDILLTDTIKESLPELEIHASTQAAIFNPFYNPVLKNISRIVAPREFTLSQIKELKKKTKLEIEVFIQGALCVSISGQCLMSSFLGGRSGNRGLCAQPCRKKYNHKHTLSPKDLSLGKDIEKLIKAGVDSLKIEGRLRSPEYVGAATSLYRKIIDEGVLDENASIDMKVAFNREFTKGALGKEFNVVNHKSPGKSGIFLGRLDSEGFLKSPINLHVGDGVGIKNDNGMHGDVVREITSKKQKLDVGKKGEKLFLNINAKPRDEIYLTKAVIRRKTRWKNTRKKINFNRIPQKISIPPVSKNQFSDKKLLVKVNTIEDAKIALESGADRVFYNIFEKDFNKKHASPYIPSALTFWDAKQALDVIESSKPEAILCDDLGVALNSEVLETYAGISLNIYNSLSLNFLNNRKITPTISPEISISEMLKQKDKRFVVYAHGRLPLMKTKYQLDEKFLTDELGYEFPVKRILDQTQILNSVPLGLFNKISNLIDHQVTHFLIEPEENTSQIVVLYKKIMDGENVKTPSGYTLGNYKQGVL